MDLFAVDRAVAAAVAAHQRSAAGMAWEAHRGVAGQRALRELEALSPSRIEAPLQRALVKHVTHLTALRVCQEPAVRLADALRDARGIVRRERDESLQWTDLWQGLLAAKTPGEARAYFAALAPAAPALAEPLRTLQQTRDEVLGRLGVDDAARYFLGTPRASLVQSARAWLARSRDLAREVTRRRPGDEPWPLDLDLRLARSAATGWPARLGWRSVAELFAGLPSKPPLALGVAPAALGAASFARALFAIGVSFRRAGAARGVPFALREPPWFTDALRSGAMFAAATMESAFHRRALGLAAGPAADQARALACSALLESRLDAGRLLLSDAGGAGADPDEITASLFGTPLTPELRGVWPAASWRAGEMAAGAAAMRWLATSTAPAHYRALRDREGDDWFRNARAFDGMRERFSADVLRDDDDDQGADRDARDADADAHGTDAAIAAMGRAFEERLG